MLPIGEKFVRKINIGLYERFDDYLESNIEAKRRSLVSEISFGIFRLSIKKNETIGNSFPSQALLRDLVLFSRERISKLDRKELNEIEEPSEDELSESIRLAFLIQRFFLRFEKNENLIIDPIFKGCGFIDRSIGDVLAGNTLYEIKSGDRKFRSVDMRQILVYCALNYASQQYLLLNVGLVNPRLGIYFKIGLDEFCINQSGRNASEVLSDIVQFISGGELSK